MIIGLVGLIIGLGATLPYFWVKYVMWRHSKDIAGMPGTGGELAEHLVSRFALEGVHVVCGQYEEDFYDPENKIVSLSPDNYHGKSLTAVAVAAHEVGHAVQFCRNEPVSRLRGKYLKPAFAIRRAAVIVIMFMPVISAVIRIPQLMILSSVLGVIMMLASAAMYAAILPEEYDASFNKALPTLEEGYVDEEHYSAVRQVLKAAAYTYVAAALIDILRIWRWFGFVR